MRKRNRKRVGFWRNLGLFLSSLVIISLGTLVFLIWKIKYGRGVWILSIKFGVFTLEQVVDGELSRVKYNVQIEMRDASPFRYKRRQVVGAMASQSIIRKGQKCDERGRRLSRPHLFEHFAIGLLEMSGLESYGHTLNRPYTPFYRVYLNVSLREDEARQFITDAFDLYRHMLKGGKLTTALIEEVLSQYTERGWDRSVTQEGSSIPGRKRKRAPS